MESPDPVLIMLFYPGTATADENSCYSRCKLQQTLVLPGKILEQYTTLTCPLCRIPPASLVPDQLWQHLERY